jgi:hypothetical protein
MKNLERNVDKIEIKANNPFIEAQRRFFLWLEKKPTGNFALDIFVNEGGVRGCKINISEFVE